MTETEVLRNARAAKGLTQEDLAAKVGVTTSAVVQWEAGKTRPRRDKAMRLDAELNAGGAILRAFGFSSPERDELAELRGRVAELERQMGRLLRAATVRVGGDVVQPPPAAPDVPEASDSP